ncbi:MAG: HAD-IB family phosphatase [Actinomycetota bacterium]|nr:HAD-IB family phosphatase [Actinomycetota bacterium]
MRFVASDLEGTLTVGETWRGVGRYLKRHGRGAGYRAFLLSRLPGVLAAKAGLADGQAVRDGFIEGMARLFRGMTRAEIERMAEWVAGEELWPKRREAVLAELGVHAESGRRVVIAAGGYQPVVEAFARRIGAEAVGTPLEFSDGRATGRLVDSVNTGKAKAERLRELVGAGELHAAYGDTSADIFMLEMSEDPVAVRPDPRLREEALRRGWRTLGTGENG